MKMHVPGLGHCVPDAGNKGNRLTTGYSNKNDEFDISMTNGVLKVKVKRLDVDPGVLGT